MIKQFFVLIVLLGYTFHLSAQTTLSEAQVKEFTTLEDSLQKLAFTIVNEKDETKRFAAAASFPKLLEDILSKDNSFDFPFDSLRSVSIIKAPDNSFRIFTWQLYVDVDDYRYFGMVQQTGKNASITLLKDKSQDMEDIEYEIGGSDNWYGAVYYKLKEFKSKEGTKYLLFGFDGYSLFNKRKVVEVLSFKDGNLVFGAPVFIKERENRRPETKNRIMLEYSVEVSIGLNFDPILDMIIFDHLINAMGSYKGQGPTSVTDGSYEGYRLKKGVWTHVDKVFDQVSETAPRPHPVLDKRKKDIHGN